MSGYAGSTPATGANNKTNNTMQNKIFIFKVGEQEEIAHAIDLNGIVSESAIAPFHYNLMAKSHAKILATHSGEKVRYYEKGKQQNAITISNL